MASEETFIKGWEGNNIHRVLFVNADGDPVDLSTATVKTIVVKWPDRTEEEKTAEFTTNGTDGLIEIVYARDDIPASGECEGRGLVVIDDVDVGTELFTFAVEEK